MHNVHTNHGPAGNNLSLGQSIELLVSFWLIEYSASLEQAAGLEPADLTSLTFPLQEAVNDSRLATFVGGWCSERHFVEEDAAPNGVAPTPLREHIFSLETNVISGAYLRNTASVLQTARHIARFAGLELPDSLSELNARAEAVFGERYAVRNAQRAAMAWLIEEGLEGLGANGKPTEREEILDATFDALGILISLLVSTDRDAVAKAHDEYVSAQVARGRNLDVPHHRLITALIERVVNAEDMINSARGILTSRESFAPRRQNLIRAAAPRLIEALEQAKANERRGRGEG